VYQCWTLDTFRKYGFVNSSLRTASQLSCKVSISSLTINSRYVIQRYLSSSFCDAVRLLIHAFLSKRTFGPVCRSLLPAGEPKKEVRDPCFSFFGADGDVTAAEREEVAFLLTFMVVPEVISRDSCGVHARDALKSGRKFQSHTRRSCSFYPQNSISGIHKEYSILEWLHE